MATRITPHDIAEMQTRLTDRSKPSKRTAREWCLRLLDELERARAQRDRAWRALWQIEDELGRGGVMAIALHLADAHGLDDCAEWNEVQWQFITDRTRCLRCGGYESLECEECEGEGGGCLSCGGSGLVPCPSCRV